MKPFTTFILLITGIFNFSVLHSQPPVSLKPGDKAPVFTALDENGQVWDIQHYLGKKNIVFFFYPAAMTGGCTSQACAYRDDLAELEKQDAIICLFNLKIGQFLRYPEIIFRVFINRESLFSLPDGISV